MSNVIHLKRVTDKHPAFPVEDTAMWCEEDYDAAIDEILNWHQTIDESLDDYFQGKTVCQVPVAVLPNMLQYFKYKYVKKNDRQSTVPV